MNYLKINKDYIIWSLLSVPVWIGIFFIIQHGIKFVVNEPSPSPEPLTKAQLNQPLTEVPNPLRAIYFTSSSAGNPKMIEHLINLSKTSGLNAVVIDIKDFSGYISYDTSVPEAEKYSTETHTIKDIDGLISKLHQNNIYIIGRMTMFQDPALVRARPDWAVRNKLTGGVWYDHKGLSWIDTTNQDAWKYLADIAKDAAGRGFDEINFDYVRFPSDGDLSIIVFPAWDKTMTRPQVLNSFFKYMRRELGNTRMSVDMFGFVTTKKQDFGVGQVIEDAFEYFDYVSPMVYPSHYPSNFMGFANPAAHPYEVIDYTVKEGGDRLTAYYDSTQNKRAHLRPWLQDFNLGADYTSAMVASEIKATQDSLGDNYTGFMLWNAGNNYHEEVFRP